MDVICGRDVSGMTRRDVTARGLSYNAHRVLGYDTGEERVKR